MRIDILTVFPEMIAAALDYSIVKRAQERGLVTIRVVNLRDFTTDRHKTTDDVPYGGGGGMVMKIEPIARALQTLTTPSPNSLPTEVPGGRTDPAMNCRSGPQNLPSQVEGQPAQAGLAVQKGDSSPCNRFLSSPEAGAGKGVATPSEAQEPPIPANFETDTPISPVVEVQYSAVPTVAEATEGATSRPRIVLTDPRGRRFTQEVAREWAKDAHLILLCGHYEGVDDRVRRHLVTESISIGDYILTGGELPALVIVDALARLQPGALGDEAAPEKDTFAENLLEYPHYTRPRVFGNWAVPDILLSGHHALIERWRRWHQLRATREFRPDLFARLQLAPQDAKLLDSEEPTAPPNAKITPVTLPLAEPEADPKNELIERTEEQEENDGTGIGNDT